MGQLHHGFHLFSLVNLFEHFLVKALDAEERALHPFSDPRIEVAQEKIDAGLHEPIDPIPIQQFDHRLRVLRNISEILVENEHVADPMRDVKPKRFLDGLYWYRLWAGREGGGLAERTRET